MAPVLAPPHDAWEHMAHPDRAGDRSTGGFAFCCEHASNRVPAPLSADQDDRGWLATHWGYDVGARTITARLVDTLGGEAVLTRFSRLVVDANRPPGHPDLIRTHVCGHRLGFNDHLGQDEVDRRIATLHAPYHQAIDDMLTRARPDVLVSIHSFTPIWSGRRRELDVGVLFDDCEDHARVVADALSAAGLRTRLNEPYSGREGLIYAAHRHGSAHGVAYIELELNQRLCFDEAHARAIAATLAPALARLRA